MPKSSFVDFKAVKAAITMEMVLEHYGILDRFKRSGDNLSGPCPIHKGANPTQFRVSVGKNIWHCFSECKGGGNVLDFIAKMEDVSIYAAALKAIEWFALDEESLKAKSGKEPEQRDDAEGGGNASPPKQTQKPAAKKQAQAAEATGPNTPLKFRLEKLEREHPYLKERGLTLQTVIDFGIGYCTKGMMAERIAIPIHNPEGNVVAYAGRWPGDPPNDTPKFKLPQGFRKALEIFNIDRAIKEPRDMPLVIVEGFFGCMMLHQNGCRRVVALMGSSMSPAQEALLRKHLDQKGRVIVMLDEDEAGRAGRDDVALRLARFAFVRIHAFGEEGSQPDRMSAEEVQALLGGAS